MIRALSAFLVIGALAVSSALADDAALRIKLEVSGAKPGTGQVLVSLFDSAENFLMAPVSEETAAVDDDGNASVSFDGLNRGDYAIAVIYDENRNGKLDTGLFRIPKEKIGFSNNAKGRFGPAKWDDARISVNQSDVVVEIRLAKAEGR